MPAKTRVLTPGTETAFLTRKTRIKPTQVPVPDASDQDIDQKLEQIRVRGAQISLDIKALLARVNALAP